MTPTNNSNEANFRSSSSKQGTSFILKWHHNPDYYFKGGGTDLLMGGEILLWHTEVSTLTVLQLSQEPDGKRRKKLCTYTWHTGTLARCVHGLLRAGVTDLSSSSSSSADICWFQSFSLLQLGDRRSHDFRENFLISTILSTEAKPAGVRGWQK